MKNRLKEGGKAGLQIITIAEADFPDYRRNPDFIQKYIFPGGFLPSMTAILDSVTKSSDMRAVHVEDIGPHYAETLRHWREAFSKNLNRIWKMNYGEQFLRMWHYYYCYCEGAFRERAIGTAQVLFVKPGARRDPIVPALDAS